MSGVELVNIEEELDRLWQGIESDNKIKAALFNLIVFQRDPEHTSYVERVTDFVIKKLPCRAIFIVGDPDSQDSYLRTHVSMEMIGTGKQPISCDQIYIDFTPEHTSRVPFLVFPHLLPDLPVCLLWEGDPTEEPIIFPQLERLATRMIFDPDSLQQLPQFARFVINLEKRFHGDVADQKWGCTEGWRNVIRRAFRSEENLDHLRYARQIRIEFSQRSTKFPRDPRIQSVYLVSWLAAQLDWQFDRLEEGEGESWLFYTKGEQKITIQLVPRCLEGEPFGNLLSVDLISTREVHFSFTHESAGNFVRVKSDSPEKCDLPYTLYLPHLTRQESFARELLRTGMSQHYFNTLRHLAEIDFSSTTLS